MKILIIIIVLFLLIIGIFYFNNSKKNIEKTIILNINEEYIFKDLIITAKSALRESTEPRPFDQPGSGSMWVNIVLNVKKDKKIEDIEFYLPAKPYTIDNYTQEWRTKIFENYKIVIIDTDELTITVKLEKIL